MDCDAGADAGGRVEVQLVADGAAEGAARVEEGGVKGRWRGADADNREHGGGEEGDGLHCGQRGRGWAMDFGVLFPKFKQKSEKVRKLQESGVSFGRKPTRGQCCTKNR